MSGGNSYFLSETVDGKKYLQIRNGPDDQSPKVYRFRNGSVKELDSPELPSEIKPPVGTGVPNPNFMGGDISDELKPSAITEAQRNATPNPNFMGGSIDPRLGPPTGPGPAPLTKFVSPPTDHHVPGKDLAKDEVDLLITKTGDAFSKREIDETSKATKMSPFPALSYQGK